MVVLVDEAGICVGVGVPPDKSNDKKSYLSHQDRALCSLNKMVLECRWNTSKQEINYSQTLSPGPLQTPCPLDMHSKGNIRDPKPKTNNTPAQPGAKRKGKTTITYQTYGYGLGDVQSTGMQDRKMKTNRHGIVASELQGHGDGWKNLPIPLLPNPLCSSVNASDGRQMVAIRHEMRFYSILSLWINKAFLPESTAVAKRSVKYLSNKGLEQLRENLTFERNRILASRTISNKVFNDAQYWIPIYPKYDPSSVEKVYKIQKSESKRIRGMGNLSTLRIVLSLSASGKRRTWAALPDDHPPNDQLNNNNSDCLPKLLSPTQALETVDLTDFRTHSPLIALCSKLSSELPNAKLLLIHGAGDDGRELLVFKSSRQSLEELFVFTQGKNILGSIFQIGTLPLILPGPLGAISLRWNLILARLLLADTSLILLTFSTILIVRTGNNSSIYTLLPRSSSKSSSTSSPSRSFAHLQEYCLNQTHGTISLLSISLKLTPPTTQIQSRSSSTNSQSNNHNNSDHSSSRNYSSSNPIALFYLHQPIDIIESHIPLTPPFSTTSHHQSNIHHSNKRHHQQSRLSRTIYHPSGSPILQLSSINNTDENGGGHYKLLSNQKIDRLNLVIGIAYGFTSGTLSGICLLFAKTGVKAQLEQL
ncbi:hypothetical protein KEM48_009220 [Puccinia striiformis f. sp. tritici PST-130]|nr:hypothetical protein KEM48_009220 [Puccinia striiformis f. sp. tritici PST-130]